MESSLYGVGTFHLVFVMCCIYFWLDGFCYFSNEVLLGEVGSPHSVCQFLKETEKKRNGETD